MDLERLDAVMSFAGGRKIMERGTVTGTGGTFLTTEAGVKTAEKMQIKYRLADTAGSTLYKER